VLESRKPCLGARIALIGADERKRTFVVNCAPIGDDCGKHRGVLVSFNDITVVEVQHAELEAHLEMLNDARTEIEQINKQLQRQASHDSLTGCLNRRAFLAQCETRWAAAERHRHGLACVMVDVDHFKSINDTHGHGVGDDVLRGVAETLQMCKRGEDAVCRWGGEEFCILLDEVDAPGARRAAERVRAALAAAPLAGVNVTASLGVATLADGAGDMQKLIDQADRALYASKRGGRNRVTLWAPALEQAA
jgi:diguanylate cyclase (GGDEF)-like protein